jgi:hypothetical protein
MTCRSLGLHVSVVIGVGRNLSRIARGNAFIRRLLVAIGLGFFGSFDLVGFRSRCDFLWRGILLRRRSTGRHIVLHALRRDSASTQQQYCRRGGYQS